MEDIESMENVEDIEDLDDDESICDDIEQLIVQFQRILVEHEKAIITLQQLQINLEIGDVIFVIDENSYRCDFREILDELAGNDESGAEFLNRLIKAIDLYDFC